MFIKYPRTPHFKWSPGATDDDKILQNLDMFNGRRVIGTKKMDGENTTLYSNHIHARSVDSRGGVDRDWVKTMWAAMAHNIPENWRICGENLWAKHSIHYTDLKSYFLAFSIWNEHNYCLSWDDTVQYLELLGIESVPVIYDGIFDESIMREFHRTLDLDKDEGYVIRLADSFHYDDFGISVAKYVREKHVQTDKHWRSQELIPNKLG